MSLTVRDRFNQVQEHFGFETHSVALKVLGLTAIGFVSPTMKPPLWVLRGHRLICAVPLFVDTGHWHVQHARRCFAV